MTPTTDPDDRAWHVLYLAFMQYRHLGRPEKATAATIREAAAMLGMQMPQREGER